MSVTSWCFTCVALFDMFVFVVRAIVSRCPSNLTCRNCLQLFFIEHLFNLCGKFLKTRLSGNQDPTVGDIVTAIEIVRERKSIQEETRSGATETKGNNRACICRCCCFWKFFDLKITWIILKPNKIIMHILWLKVACISWVLITC